MRHSRLLLIGLTFAALSGTSCSEDSEPPPSSTPDASVSVACPEPTGPGTNHSQDIKSDETWTFAGSPHRVTGDIRVTATVTVEPCVTVSLAERAHLVLGNTPNVAGRLVARGTAAPNTALPTTPPTMLDTTGIRPIWFQAADASKPWGSIIVNPAASLDLEWAVLADAAHPDTAVTGGGGAVLAYGPDEFPPTTVGKNVRASKVFVLRARGHAFNFQRIAGFSGDSSDVVVLDSGSDSRAWPIRLAPGAVGTLPANVVLQGNKKDEVLVAAGNTAMLSDTFPAQRPPYRIAGRLAVAPYVDGAPAKLTIGAGATLRMDTGGGSDSGIYFGSSSQRQGVLVAVGTAAAPIVFTSGRETPAAADWKNLYFLYSPSTGNRIDHAVIEYAGAPSGAQGYGCGPIENDASVLLLAGRPDEAFISNTLLRNGGGDTGILLGWVSDLAGPDFTVSNTFTAMPPCTVSRWRNATGNACPGSTAGSPICF